LESSLHSEREKNKEMQGKVDTLQGELSAKIQLSEQLRASFDSKNREYEELKQSSKQQLETVISSN
jgi:hypothetical protein